MVQQQPFSGGIQLLLTPNQSLSWRGNVRIWLALLAVSALIATGMALAGAWMIIPFAGLELAALAAGIYLTAQACQRREILSIGEDNIHLETGRRRKLAEWTLPRRYARLVITPPAHPFTAPKLLLAHRDTEVAVGTFLNIEDTRQLIDTLESRGLRVEHKAPDLPTGLWF